MGEPAISISSLTKIYGERKVVDGVDLEIADGEIFSLLGPNGAGKTTTVEILEGFRRPSEGSVRVLGIDPLKGDSHWRDQIGLVLQTSGAFDDLTPRECVRAFAKTYSNPMDVDTVLKQVGLSDHSSKRADKLSGGQRRRLEVACGVVGRPKVLFLDEPTTGLDPEGRREAWELIEGLRETGVTILLTTHYLEEAEFLADRVGVIKGGKIIALGTAEDLRNEVAIRPQVRFRFEGASTASLPRLDGTVHIDGDLVSVDTDSPTQVVSSLAAWFSSRNTTEIPSLEVHQPSLEDSYLALVADTATPADTNG